MSVTVEGVQALRFVGHQGFAIGATATNPGNAVNGQWARITSNVACHFLFSAESTAAATTDTDFPAGAIEYRKIIPGEFLSVITATGGAGAFSVEESVE